MMIIVLKVELHDDKIKKKAMKKVAGISGVLSQSVDMKDSKLTLKGDVDAVKVVKKLRKLCYTEIVSVEPEKKDKPKPPDHDDCRIPQPYPYPYPLAISMQEDPACCVIC